MERKLYHAGRDDGGSTGDRVTRQTDVLCARARATTVSAAARTDLFRDGAREWRRPLLPWLCGKPSCGHDLASQKNGIPRGRGFSGSRGVSATDDPAKANKMLASHRVNTP